MSKPILCLDFDGVIHSYKSGWQGADVIPDSPVPGAMHFICQAVEEFSVSIFSSRSSDHRGYEEMQRWLIRRMIEFWEFDQKARRSEAVSLAHNICDQINWPIEKPPAMVTIDDRAITFTGTFPDMETLKSFKPWNRMEQSQ